MTHRQRRVGYGAVWTGPAHQFHGAKRGLAEVMAAAPSRHTNIGITTGTPSGIGFTLLLIV